MIIIIIIIIILVIITPSGQLAGQGGLDICRDRRSNRQHAFSEQTINYSFNLCPSPFCLATSPSSKRLDKYWKQQNHCSCDVRWWWSIHNLLTDNGSLVVKLSSLLTYCEPPTERVCPTLLSKIMMMIMTMMAMMTMMMMVMMIISKVMEDNREEGRDLAEHHTPRPACTSPISTPGQRNSSKMMEIVTSFELAWISSKTEVKMAMSRFNNITLPNNI